jgi:hypothetical protein
MMKANSILGYDDHEEIFIKSGDFLRFLEEREKNTIRYDAKSSDFNFLSIGHSLHFYKTEEALAKRLNVSMDLLQDTKWHTNLIAAINKEPYLIGSSAWNSLKNRIDVYGGGFDKLHADTKALVLKERFMQEDKAVKIIVCEGKIRAVMSQEYAVIPAYQLFQEVLQKVEERFEDFITVIALADHNRAVIKIVLPSVKEDINSLYNLPDEYIPGLIIETSDTGYSANKIGSFWLANGRGSFINKNEYIYLPHVGNVKLDDVLEQLPNLFLKFQNTLKKFASLMQIEVEFPVKTLKAACKKLKVPKKYVKLIVEQFEGNLPQGAKATAYDICREVFTLPNFVNDSERRKDFEELAGKAINLNYTALQEDEDEE